MSSVAFWYQTGIAGDQPDVPYCAARLPLGNAQQIEVEDRAADATAKDGRISVEKDVFWSKDVLMFTAKGAGSRVTIPFDVAEEGRYELVAELAHSPDYGTYTVELDGQPSASASALEHERGANTGDQSAIDAYFTETYVAEDHTIGWAALAKGRHTLTFVCTGKNPLATGYNLGIDTLILARPFAKPAATDAASRAASLRRIGERRTAGASQGADLVRALSDSSSEVREAAAWSLGQVTAPLAIEPLTAALADDDEVVRGLAALALRERGVKAAAAKDALLERLGDSETGVRMMAAQAIGRLHDAATIDPLIAACKVEGQHVHVLRSLADALGTFGPDASRALQVLNDLAKIPRVEWAAKAAIGKIEAPAISPAARKVTTRQP
jgi:hypothetical protein